MQKGRRQIIAIVVDVRLHMYLELAVVAYSGQKHVHLAGLVENTAGLLQLMNRCREFHAVLGKVLERLQLGASDELQIVHDPRLVHRAVFGL